ncbi:MAG: hypothetical protein ISS26_07050 [Candidatus Omnitrophica bacterium]|nr:hypothetical protein [Candidatus Omnitrophota bacterium]
MKTIVRNIIVGLSGICWAFTSPICAEPVENEEVTETILGDIPLEMDADIAFNSKYIWRGFNLDDDPVFQPGGSIGAYGFTASVWGSYDIDDDDGVDGDEFDIILDYTYEYDIFSLSAGNTFYFFPGTDGESYELYIGGAVDTLLSPSLTFYYDYGDEDDGGADGLYLVFEASHSIPIFEMGESEVSLDLNSHVAYNHELFISGEGGDFGIGAALTIPLNEHVTASPAISYSVPFGDMSDSDDGNQDDEFYFGTTWSFSI